MVIKGSVIVEALGLRCCRWLRPLTCKLGVVDVHPGHSHVFLGFPSAVATGAFQGVVVAEVDLAAGDDLCDCAEIAVESRTRMKVSRMGVTVHPEREWNMYLDALALVTISPVKLRPSSSRRRWSREVTCPK